MTTSKRLAFIGLEASRFGAPTVWPPRPPIRVKSARFPAAQWPHAEALFATCCAAGTVGWEVLPGWCHCQRCQPKRSTKRSVGPPGSFSGKDRVTVLFTSSKRISSPSFEPNLGILLVFPVPFSVVRLAGIQVDATSCSTLLSAGRRTWGTSQGWRRTLQLFEDLSARVAWHSAGSI